MLLGVFGVCGLGGVGLTLEFVGPLGVNSFAVGFSENSLAFGFKVDFLTLSLSGVLLLDGGELPTSVEGAGGELMSGGAGVAIS